MGKGFAWGGLGAWRKLLLNFLSWNFQQICSNPKTTQDHHKDQIVLRTLTLTLLRHCLLMVICRSIVAITTFLQIIKASK